MSRKIVSWWELWSHDVRQDVINLLKAGTPLERMPLFWRYKPHNERIQIIKELYEQGSLTNHQLHVLFGDCTTVERPSFVAERMLSAQYTHLTDTWRRGNGVTVRPKDMNDGHLENSLKLLKESHGNVVAKACMMIGAIHAQFHAVTGIREYTESLCIQLQKVDVGTLYPVFEPMADELRKRREAVRPPICDTIDMFNSLMDQEIASWGVEA